MDVISTLDLRVRFEKTIVKCSYDVLVLAVASSTVLNFIQNFVFFFLSISILLFQIYKGLDIITAKATPEERSIAPHHLLDFLLPHQTCTVVDFRNRAVKIVSFSNTKITEYKKKNTFSLITTTDRRFTIEKQNTNNRRRNELLHRINSLENSHRRHRTFRSSSLRLRIYSKKTENRHRLRQSFR